MEEVESVTKSKDDKKPDLYPDIEALLRVLAAGDERSEEAAEMLLLLIAQLPSFVNDERYLSYCMLVAIAADVLRAQRKEPPFAEKDALYGLSVLHGERGYFRPLAPLRSPLPAGREVHYFLKFAKECFAKLCWHMCAPDTYPDINEGDYDYLWGTSSSIPDDDVRKSKCQFVVHGLRKLFSTSSDDMQAVLQLIREIEFGERR